MEAQSSDRDRERERERTHLNSGQHARRGHTEVQVGQTIRVGGLVKSWRFLLWKVIYNTNLKKKM